MLVVFVTFLAALLLYLDRFCISYTQQYIKEDLGLSEFEFSLCLSAFFWAYALGQVPSGWLSDRFGARWMLTIYVIAWSSFTAMVGLATGFLMLVLLRIALGLGQAGAYPTSAALIRNWVPLSERGKANSFVAFGGRLGGFVAPVLTVYLVVAFVPLDRSSLLTPDDLLDIDSLSLQLAEPDANVHAKEIEVEQARIKVAKQVVPGVKPKWLEGLSTDEEAEANQDSVKQMLAHLNSFIEITELRESIEWDVLPLEDEAKSMRGLSKLTPSQNERLNRLVLEATFPKCIRKVYVHGWRRVMFVYGSFGVIVAGLFWICFRNRPADHPWIRSAEIELIDQNQPKAANNTSEAVPFGAMVRSRNLWLMCVNQFGGNVGWIFLMTWLPRYLLEVHSVPFVQRGWMAAIPLSVGWIGILAGGWTADRVTSRFGLRWRTAPIVGGRVLAMSAYIAVLFAPSAMFAVIAFSCIALCNDFTNPSSWAYKQDVGGKHVGSIHGWANMWGNFGAASSPIVLERVISMYGWNGAFIAGAAAFLIAGLAAAGVDARIPIVRDEA